MVALLCPFAVLLAVAAPAPKAPPELKGIDATCKAAARLDEAHKLNARSFISDAILPEAHDGRVPWRAFETGDEMRAYLEKEGAANTSAWLWNAPDGTTIVGMYFQSDTGDWSQDVDYCFRPDGSLARLEAKISNLAGGPEGERVRYLRGDGGVLFERAKAFDGRHKRLPDADDLDQPPLYPTVNSLPFLAPAGSEPPASKAPIPDGSLDRDGVTRFVEAHAGDAQSCYEREAAKYPELAGVLVMNWAIEVDGTTSHIQWIRDTLRSPAVESCVEQVIGRWRFVVKPHKRLYAEHQFELHAKAPRGAGGAEADANLDPSGIATFVKAHRGAVTGCMAHRFAKPDEIAGKVVISWTIDATGGTRAIRIEPNALTTPDIESCLQDVVRKWHFSPQAGGSVDVSFPFVFEGTKRSDAGAGGKKR